MQQAARRRAAGERLALRVGLHAGEALREETDYLGTPVVIARRLCAQAQLAGDFREFGIDARLAMAQLCALTGRPGEAHHWFERARALLDEQGARPLRALVDLDEAWMEVRRGPHGDRNRARALLDVACEQFQAIGMPGWLERAEALRAQCEEMGVGDRGSGFGEEKRVTDGDRVEAVAESGCRAPAPDPRPPIPLPQPPPSSATRATSGLSPIRARCAA